MIEVLLPQARLLLEILKHPKRQKEVHYESFVKYTYLIYFCSKEFVIFVFHSSHFFNHCIWQHYSASFSLPPTKRLYLLPFYLRKSYIVSFACIRTPNIL